MLEASVETRSFELRMRIVPLTRIAVMVAWKSLNNLAALHKSRASDVKDSRAVLIMQTFVRVSNAVIDD
jgi:hypothetical protein